MMKTRDDLENKAGLAPDEVHLWWVNLNLSEGQKMLLYQHLTSTERDRGGNFRLSMSKRQFEVSRGALRHILSRYIQTEPSSIDISTTPQGKPYLVDDHGLYFNLSHAADQAVIAVGRVKKLGIDLEEITPDRDIAGLARRVFSQLELEEYLSLPVGQRSAGFYNGWTRKEAYLKAIGVGIGASLREFAVNLTPHKPPRLVWVKGQPVEPQFWTLQHLKRNNRMVGALAIRQIGIRVTAREFRIT